MSLRFSILASGSTGNAMVVDNGEVRLLIDAGLSARKIETLLEQMDMSCAQLDAVLVTHEHADHIQGLGALARRYQLPVYANKPTWEAMESKVGELKPEQRKMFRTGETLDFGLLQVQSYEVSHDAAEPVGFSFMQGDTKVCLMTDMGYVSPNVKKAVKEADVLILECNHDTEMLRAGRYPWNVKRRILGDLGHLSNELAAEALVDLVTEKLRKVYLAHLSRDHNMLELARMTVHQRLQESGVKWSHVELKDTYFDRPTLWDDLNER
jgi:phosphoribosyl 1,2-cyclic phosphodiesterase